MTIGWQKVKLPLLERLALAELAERRSASEEAVLAQLVREAVKAELTDPTAPTETKAADHDRAA